MISSSDDHGGRRPGAGRKRSGAALAARKAADADLFPGARNPRIRLWRSTLLVVLAARNDDPDRLETIMALVLPCKTWVDVCKAVASVSDAALSGALKELLEDTERVERLAADRRVKSRSVAAPTVAPCPECPADQAPHFHCAAAGCHRRLPWESARGGVIRTFGLGDRELVLLGHRRWVPADELRRDDGRRPLAACHGCMGDVLDLFPKREREVLERDVAFGLPSRAELDLLAGMCDGGMPRGKLVCRGWQRLDDESALLCLTHDLDGAQATGCIRVVRVSVADSPLLSSSAPAAQLLWALAAWAQWLREAPRREWIDVSVESGARLIGSVSRTPTPVT